MEYAANTEHKTSPDSDVLTHAEKKKNEDGLEMANLCLFFYSCLWCVFKSRRLLFFFFSPDLSGSSAFFFFVVMLGELIVGIAKLFFCLR